MATLPANIRSLSIDEKYDLLDALWVDIEANSPSLTEEQEQELDRRIATYSESPSAVLTWEQVKSELPKP